jgi:hypothetical protein
MAKSKKLTLSVVKRDDTKLYGIRKQVDVQGYEFTVDTVFRPSKINALLQEFLSDLEYFHTKDIDITNLDMTGYISVLIVKYFSDFDVPEDPALKLQTIKLLIDGSFFNQMLEAFDAGEIEGVVERMNQFVEALKDGIDKARDLLEKQQEEDKDDSETEG